MRRQAVIFLILALAAGGLVAILASRMLRTPPAMAESGPASVTVVVAARDMNVGTLLDEDDVSLVDWPAGAVPVGYSTSAAEVVGRGLLSPVVANEPCSQSSWPIPSSGVGCTSSSPREAERCL